IVISKVRPYRGAITIIDEDKKDLIGSGAFTVLRENSTYKKEIILLLFRTNIYKEWLLKWNVGTSYPVIKDEDILNLPIPLLPDSIQSTIADLLQKSIRHKKKSLELLNDAVKLVEKEIEKNIDNK
ncbi:MAG: restriction endonuclease subunit S, partial [Acetivibrio ethanolgignens]